MLVVDRCNKLECLDTKARIYKKGGGDNNG